MRMTLQNKVYWEIVNDTMGWDYKDFFDAGWDECQDHWVDYLSGIMPDDFKDWWQNSADELPLVTRKVIESLREQEKLAWDMLGRVNSKVEVMEQALNKIARASRIDNQNDDYQCWMDMKMIAQKALDDIKN